MCLNIFKLIFTVNWKSSTEQGICNMYAFLASLQCPSEINAVGQFFLNKITEVYEFYMYNTFDTFVLVQNDL